MFYIYRITNLINHKLYIGQTNDHLLRWSQHKSDAKYNSDKQVITRAISKYKPENFVFDVIATCITQNDTDETETVLIKQYESHISTGKGYNVDMGGKSSPRTPEICQKISEGLNKFYETHEGWNKGGNLTQEWKDKVSKSHFGLPGANTGRTFDDQWKLNISKSSRGKECKTRRRFSKEIEQDICRLYTVENKSTYSLGKQFKCQRATITTILTRNDIKIRKSYRNNGKNIFTIEQELEICKKYKEGNITRIALAKEFKCGKTTIRDVLLRNNVKL